MDPTHNTLPLSPSPSCRIGVPSPIYPPFRQTPTRQSVGIGLPWVCRSVT
ncbi:hypothetical protein HanIR_Chr15g0742141 [Helianthus annuus]|nr:hypothetical protein HanIR_Chr15g0742141 [Helianthus annuus]